MHELTDDSLLPKNRLETLTDGIFAITMTLIILDLKTPENIPYNLAEQELPEILVNLLPSIEAYAISFIILGVFWLRHQIQFKYIRSTNRMLLSVNMIFLLLIGFVPFTVGIMMRYPLIVLPFRIYVINLILISIVMTYQWILIGKSKKISAIDISQKHRKTFLILTSIPIFIFILSYIISFINLRAAFFIIYLDPIFYLVYRLFLRRNTQDEAGV
ncbi:MAG: TMEM175 family protein [bacterium]|nr:TMEM175 family protein [bacterium]